MTDILTFDFQEVRVLHTKKIIENANTNLYITLEIAMFAQSMLISEYNFDWIYKMKYKSPCVTFVAGTVKLHFELLEQSLPP